MVLLVLLVLLSHFLSHGTKPELFLLLLLLRMTPVQYTAYRPYSQFSDPVTGTKAQVTAMARTSGRRSKITYSGRRANLRKEVKLCMRRLTERKHSSTAENPSPVAVAGNVASLSILSQGTSATTRIAQQVYVDYVEAFGVIACGAASGGDTVRIILAVDHEPIGSNPAVTDVLESAAYNAPYNLDKVGSRFRIVQDQTWGCYPPASSVVGMTCPFHWKCKIRTTSFYQSNAGTISDLLKNNVFVIFLSQNGNASVFSNFQLVFKDL